MKVRGLLNALADALNDVDYGFRTKAGQEFKSEAEDTVDSGILHVDLDDKIDTELGSEGIGDKSEVAKFIAHEMVQPRIDLANKIKQKEAVTAVCSALLKELQISDMALPHGEELDLNQWEEYGQKLAQNIRYEQERFQLQEEHRRKKLDRIERR